MMEFKRDAGISQEDLLQELESLRRRVAELEGIQLHLTNSEQALGEGAMAAVSKPYEAGQLIELVRKVLDET